MMSLPFEGATPGHLFITLFAILTLCALPRSYVPLARCRKTAGCSSLSVNAERVGRQVGSLLMSVFQHGYSFAAFQKRCQL